MPIHRLSLCVVMLAMAMGWTASVARAVPVVTPVSSPIRNEVRGLWVLRSTLTSPQRIAELVRTAAAGGYDTLLVQVRGRGDAYYHSEVDPRAAELGDQPASFDPLATTLEAAHAAGLKVHAWINVNLVASATSLPRSRDHIVPRHPGWLMVPRAIAADLYGLDPRTPEYVGRLARWTRDRGDTVEGLYLSPVSDGAQDYTLSVIAELTRSYPLDGVHLDYIRYPSAEFDYSRMTVDAFRREQLPKMTGAERDRLDRLGRTDPLVWTRTYPDGWARFRRDRLTELVRRIRDVVKRERPTAVISSAVVPDPAQARDGKLQDWAAWAEAGLLDVVCPMAYAQDRSDFAAQIEAATHGAHGRPIWAGIGAWRLPVGRVAEHLMSARKSGAAGVLLFSYDSLLTVSAPRGAFFAQLRPSLVGDRSGDR
ncbi:MAG: family 10 glycosylhydrolase [Acidobacteria bacterium]|nr:family 10 glycosylhydrolase [Acidobacteriota bacterium]